MKDNIIKFIHLSKLHKKNLDTDPENFKENNKLALKVNNLGDIIESEDNFLIFYINIIFQDRELAWFIAIRIKLYEQALWRKIYQAWYDLDREKNFAWEFILNHWYDILEIPDNKRNNIEKYNKWKKENPVKHKKIIEEFNKVLYKLEKEQKKENKWFFQKIFWK